MLTYHADMDRVEVLSKPNGRSYNMTDYGIGFDQHDLDHMDNDGATVTIVYTVRGADGRIIHHTDLLADGPTLASALRQVAEPVDA